jgi:hypothetical protein
MKIAPIENMVFGAVVTDVSLGSLRDHEFATIEAAFLEYGFLISPELFPSNEDSIAFGNRFGELDLGQPPYCRTRMSTTMVRPERFWI